MKQTLTQPEELDQILMTIAGHDLKKVVDAIDDALSIYLQEVNKKFISATEVQYIAERMTDMHHAGREMLLCIDEILTALDKADSSVKPSKATMPFAGLDYLIAQKQNPHAAAIGRYSGERTDSLPSLWHM